MGWLAICTAFIPPGCMARSTIRRRARRPGFSLIELLVVILIIAILIAILLPALANARRAGRTVICRTNLKQLATAISGYATDFKNLIPSYSWTVGNTPSSYPDLTAPFPARAFVTDANARQATDIIRRHSPEPNFPLRPNWIPSVDYSPLVLLDYLSARLPQPGLACPEDRCLLLWQRDIAGFNVNAYGTLQPSFREDFGPGWPNSTFGEILRAKPYSSSYETVPCAYDSTPYYGARIAQNGAPIHYLYGLHQDTRIGGNRMDQVAFPSVKVHMHDTHQRHWGRPLYFAHADAVQPVLNFDGSVIDRRTRDSGLGWSPMFPNNLTLYTRLHYRPFQYEPRTSTGEPMEELPGVYRWTRGGLKGVDFGPEVTNAR